MQPPDGNSSEVRRQGREADRASLSLPLPLVLLNLSSYYLALLAGLAPRLASPLRAVLVLTVLVVVPQAIAGMAPDVPGPDYYACISLVFLLGAVAWLGVELRGRMRTASADSIS